MVSLRPGDATRSEHECSAKRCRAEAAYALLWRNPRIHGETRRKVWLACEEHREQLTGFLSVRGFPLEVVPVSGIPADAG
ncbi:MAG: hypothetical protein LWW86_06560 [Micrococcales bacterium]|nr:hypothetical protein [Micrococcales bacterium]